MGKLFIFLIIFFPGLALASQPNIVYIMLDDLGFGQFNSPHIETLALDSLRASGLTFDRFYVHPMCTDTRVGFLSGKAPLSAGTHRALGGTMGDYGQYRGVDTGDYNGSGPAGKTLPEILRNGGYNTLHFGKWHASSFRGGIQDPLVLFDFLESFYASKTTHMNPVINRFKNEIVPAYDTSGYSNSGHVSKVHTDHIVDFIKNYNHTKPFFINFWSVIPHVPFIRPPGTYPNTSYYANNAEGNQHAMITYFDRQIQRILDALDSEGLASNTVFIVTSDNGQVQDDIYGAGYNPIHDGSGGLRGFKSDVYEGGIRQNMVIRWPASLPAAAEGYVNHSYRSIEDMLPTFADLAGVQVPGDSWMYGGSFAHMLRDKNYRITDGKDEPFYTIQADQFDENYGPENNIAKSYIYSMIENELKLVRFNDGFEFFKLKYDADESNDLSGSNGSTVNTMKDKFVKWKMATSKVLSPYVISGSGVSEDSTGRFDFNSVHSGTVKMDQNVNLLSFNYPTTFRATVRSNITGAHQVITSVPDLFEFYIDSDQGLYFKYRERDKDDNKAWRIISAGTVPAYNAHHVGFVIYPTSEFRSSIYIYNKHINASGSVSTPYSTRNLNLTRLVKVGDPKIYIGSNNGSRRFYGWIQDPRYYLTQFPGDEMIYLFPAQGQQDYQDDNCSVDEKIIPHGMSTTMYKFRFVYHNRKCSEYGRPQTRICNHGSLTGSSNRKYTDCNVIPKNQPPTCTMTQTPQFVSPGTSVTFTWTTNYANVVSLYPIPGGAVDLNGSETVIAENLPVGTKKWFYVHANGPGSTSDTICSAYYQIQ